MTFRPKHRLVSSQTMIMRMYCTAADLPTDLIVAFMSYETWVVADLAETAQDMLDTGYRDGSEKDDRHVGAMMVSRCPILRSATFQLMAVYQE
jgi:hypothetical protein